MNNIFNSLIISKENEEIRLRQENEDDFIEYKLRLDTKNKLGKQKLASQMNYRMEIGKLMLGRKEAHYVLGIKDNGTLGKLSEHELRVTLNILYLIIKSCDASVEFDIVTSHNSDDGNIYFLAYVIVQKIENIQIKEINVAFVGPSQHGKTTTVSSLAYGQTDDGNGFSRNLVFKHAHEKQCGITSSIKQEIIGLFGDTLVNYNTGITTGWEDIVDMSDKIVNLIDLPGNLKYFKSTFVGLSAYRIDSILIVISPEQFIEPDIYEIDFYKSFAEIFDIPYMFVVINDGDVINHALHTDVFNKLNIDISSNINKIAYFSNISYSDSSNDLMTTNYDKIISFLSKTENTTNLINSTNLTYDSVPLFCVLVVYNISDVGLIFSGTMKYGTLSVNDNIYITDGHTYYKSKIKSIHKKQIDSLNIYANENGAISLEITPKDKINQKFNNHMVITTDIHDNYDTFLFELLGNNIQSTIGTFRCDQIVQCSLFVDNITTSVTVKSVKDNKILLQSNKKIIVPSIKNPKCISFLQYGDIVVFGKLYVGSLDSLEI
jgi:GTPase